MVPRDLNLKVSHLLTLIVTRRASISLAGVSTTHHTYSHLLLTKGVAMIFCWGGPDFKPQTDDR
jgi:hypothetical protein